MANLFEVAKLLVHKPIEELLKMNASRGELLHYFILNKQEDKIAYLTNSDLFRDFYQKWHNTVYNSNLIDDQEKQNVKYILDLYKNMLY